MNKTAKIYIAGHRGLVGSALMRRLTTPSPLAGRGEGEHAYPNLSGPGDNYHPENSHVIPALIRKFHSAKQSNAPTVTVWGTGTPRREFLYSDDMADACVFLMNLPDEKYHGEPNMKVVILAGGLGTRISEETHLKPKPMIEDHVPGIVLN